MEILEKAELFSEGDERLFSHSVVVYRENGVLKIAESTRRAFGPSEIDPTSWPSRLIPLDNVYPLCPEWVTKCIDCSLHEPIFVKRPSLLDYGCGREDDTRNLLLTEVEFGEILRRNPHPNVAKYHGCEIRDGRIVGICWMRCNGSLEDHVQRLTNVTTAHQWIDGIRKGVNHIHSLGYCHNDICPENILFADDESPVIIDFDSCRPAGAELSIKGGTPGWCDEDATLSLPENDHHSVYKVEQYILASLRQET